MDKTIGIYIHIPFCASKCAYCDFYSLAGCDNLMPEYEAAVIRHIKEASSQLGGYYIDTVYFGGGTPGYFGVDRLINIFEALKQNGNVLIESEVTVEMNPDSTDYEGLLKLRKAGVNRLSLGVQSANEGILKSLGRRHNFAQAEAAVKAARSAGFDNVSLDLIYGLPSQTREDWSETLTRAAALKPEHMSCYGLKIEEGTPLYTYKDSPFIPDDDTQADMYLYTIDALARYGYRQYEISNFAKRGCHSRHNLKYWQGDEYMGFGAASHSYMGSQRYSCVSDIGEYIAGIMGGGTVVNLCEKITSYEKAGEYLMLGLRTTHGISEAEYREIYPHSFDLTRTLLETFVKNGWAVKNEDRWSLTPRGFLISNVLIGGVLESQTRQKLRECAPYKASDMPDDLQYSMFTRGNDGAPLFNGI